MKFCTTILVVLAISGLTLAHYGHQKLEHGKGQESHVEVASSYAHVVKHDEPVKVVYHHEEYKDHKDNHHHHHQQVHQNHHKENKESEHKYDFGHYLFDHHKLEKVNGHHEEHQEEHHENYYSHPQYKFDNGLKIQKSDDQKKHWEERKCDQVKGFHEFKEADGGSRVVEYVADYYSHPQYKFEYGVKDHTSGDQKKHWEEREGDKVKGSYEFKEADGTIRVVEYVAGKHNGFQAVVKNIGEQHGHDHHYNHHHAYEHHF